ncbi:MAG: hypothetical protein WCP98_04300 [Actinomycetes bacterium]
MSTEPTSGLTPIYYRVSPAIWRQRKWTEDMRLLALYLLTCPHRTAEGLFVLPLPYICGDMKWLPERLAEPFADLLADGFFEYDEEDEVCFIVKALHYQPPRNPNMVKAAIRRVQTVPETTLDEHFMNSALSYCQSLAESLAESLPKRYGQPPLLLSSSPLLSAHSAGGREALPEPTPARAPIKDGTMLLCPKCGTQVSYNGDGKNLSHCPHCNWQECTP